MINIFIANLDWSITSEDLKTTFSAFGEVHYAHVVYEKETKRSRGYGYVEMEDANAAIAAIQALNGVDINGRIIDVKIASPKGNRPPKKEPVKVEKKVFKKKTPFKPYQKKPNDTSGYVRNNYSQGSYATNNQHNQQPKERFSYAPQFDNRTNKEDEQPVRVMRPRKKNMVEKVERQHINKTNDFSE